MHNYDFKKNYKPLKNYAIHTTNNYKTNQNTMLSSNLPQSMTINTLPSLEGSISFCMVFENVTFLADLTVSKKACVQNTYIFNFPTWDLVKT